MHIAPTINFEQGDGQDIIQTLDGELKFDVNLLKRYHVPLRRFNYPKSVVNEFLNVVWHKEKLNAYLINDIEEMDLLFELLAE